MTITINGTTGIAGVDGSASTPVVQGTDTNTGIFFPAADTIAFAEGGAEVARFDSSGNLGLGTTSVTQFGSAYKMVEIVGTDGGAIRLRGSSDSLASQDAIIYKVAGSEGALWVRNYANGIIGFMTNNTERARIASGGEFLIGKTSLSDDVVGIKLGNGNGDRAFTVGNLAWGIMINRQDNDGTLMQFRQANTDEGSISVSGTTVSYNGGHLSRWAQILTKPDLLKGTVMSNLDEMNVYTKDGEPVDNEQLNKVKVSDVEGDVNVAGVFVNWEYDEAHQVDEINMAMTGDMIIRIAQGVVVQKGDLLMSAGDGTAKPQGDDIVRSKTVAKVTSNHVTCTYADGSYCVPCVLMAC